MSPLSLALILILMSTAVAFVASRTKALSLVGGRVHELHSLPGHYGLYALVWCLLPALLVLAIWIAIGPAIVDGIIVDRLHEADPTIGADRLGLILNDVRNYVSGNLVSEDIDPALAKTGEAYRSLLLTGLWGTFVASVAVALAGAFFAFSRIRPDMRARNKVERVVWLIMVACSLVAVLVTVGIVLSLVFEAGRFFAKVSPLEFLFGLHWSPQMAMRADQVASEGSFGAVPLFAGTLLITFIAMLVAVPVGLLSAVYMTQYADHRVRSLAKPMLEILAGVPTVVYGFFAALVVAPWIRDTGGLLGLSVASESALAAGLVMGVMIIPFMSSLSDDALTAVPQSMRDGSYALGATRAETIRSVLIPAALPGIVGAFLLSVSRAIGETMIVVMAAGLAANLTANPLEAVTTVTVQIATLLVGDQEFDSAKTLAAFALGLVLFIVTLSLNVIALRVVRKYREQYD